MKNVNVGKNANAGFSLIELMIVLALIGVITAIAVPSYQAQQQKSRRADAISALEKAAAREEQHYFQYNVYTADESQLGGTASYITSPEGYYRIVATQAGGNTQEYMLTATPPVGSPQTNDSACKQLTLNHLGVKSAVPATNADLCWNR